MDKCKSCFETNEVLPVEIRKNRESGWVESSIKRCANNDCWAIREGSHTDRLVWIGNVYDYKYFGDYELSPEQLSAVWDAFYLARTYAE